MQVSQYLIFTEMPLTTTSLMRGKRNWGVPSEAPSYPSGSGGCAFRGIIPGSLPEVSKRRIISCKFCKENNSVSDIQL